MDDGVEDGRPKRQGAAVRRDEHRASAEPAHARIRPRIPQRVQRNVAADEIAHVPLRDVESRPSVPTADFQETAAGAHPQDVAEGLRLRNGREAVQADCVPEDCALDPPRDLASRLGVPLSESIDRVRIGHGSHDIAREQLLRSDRPEVNGIPQGRVAETPGILESCQRGNAPAG